MSCYTVLYYAVLRCTMSSSYYRRAGTFDKEGWRRAPSEGEGRKRGGNEKRQVYYHYTLLGHSII